MSDEIVIPSSRLLPVKGDLLGGIFSAIIALPTSIVCGLLAFSPLGPEYAATGVLAGLTGTILISITTALFGGSALQISGPRSSLAMIMAAILVGLDESLGLTSQAQNREVLLLALMYLSLFLAGAIQLIFGYMKLGGLIKFVPFSVISGLVNGFAVMIIIKQLPAVFGLSQNQQLVTIFNGQTELHTTPLIVALISIATYLSSQRLLKNFPGAIVGLVAGTLAFHLISPTATLSPGLIGAIPPVSLEIPNHLFVWFAGFGTTTDALPLALNLFTSALALAFLGSALSLLSASVTESLSHVRHNGNKELVGQGLANMLSAAFGGMAGAGAAMRSVTNYKAGGRTRWAGLFHALFFITVLLGLSSLIEQISLAAIAGVLIVMAMKMLDWRILAQVFDVAFHKNKGAEQHTITNVAVTLLVMTITVAIDFVTAAGVGVVVASLAFSARSGKIIVRARHLGNKLRSKTARPREAMSILERHGQTISIFEAQGPIFFGSADQLAKEIEDALNDIDICILDLRRVTVIDDTGLKILMRLQNSISDKNKLFLISHLDDDSPLWATPEHLTKVPHGAGLHTFSDTDSALSYAEDIVLDKHCGSLRWDFDVPLAQMDLALNLNDNQTAYLKSILKEQSFCKGDVILNQGEHTTQMYLLVSGSVSVMVSMRGRRRSVRLSGLRPGVTFGEMGLINGLARSTSVIADQKVTCLVLSRSAFDEMTKDRPDIFNVVMMNMLRETSNRLRVTSAHVSELER
ncbi:MAG: SLC26A/SulP transporter family protein [Magnetovibrio sp.]|nr:SLC26A/SulP transporter family protein [Magnetovibrio sp.]